MYGWDFSSDARVRAQARYDAAHTTRISLKLNLRTDQDILQWLDKQVSMQGAIKRLIRKEIARMDAEGRGAAH